MLPIVEGSVAKKAEDNKDWKYRSMTNDFHFVPICVETMGVWGPKGYKFINTSYLTDSYIRFTLKLESGQNVCSNRSIRSSTYGKKNIFEIPPCGSHFLLIHFTY